MLNEILLAIAIYSSASSEYKTEQIQEYAITSTRRKLSGIDLENLNPYKL